MSQKISKLNSARERRVVRHRRVTGRVRGTAARPRLSVFRSNRYLSVQLIDDSTSRTILGLRESGREADKLGKHLAKEAQSKKIKQVVFDRGGYRYAGRIKKLAEAARLEGLTF